MSLTAAWAGSAGLDGVARTVAIEVANLAAWGSLWVAQFMILDRHLFRPSLIRPTQSRPSQQPAAAASVTTITSHRTDEAA